MDKIKVRDVHTTASRFFYSSDLHCLGHVRTRFESIVPNIVVGFVACQFEILTKKTKKIKIKMVA